MEQPQDASVFRNSDLLWGAIDQEVSSLAGMWSPRPVASILLRPQIPPAVRDAVLAEVPADMLPTSDDTVKSLVRRLSQSAFLEDIHVLKGGKGPARVRLNATSYSQPRRRSTSVEVEPEHMDDGGDRIATRLCYTAYGRLPSDWAAEQMSRAQFNLGYYCWLASHPVLTQVSQACPPTGMQLCAYYRLFGGRMGRHRDNYTHTMMMEVVHGKKTLEDLTSGSHHGGDANSQVIGSNVLIWTEGDADMTFALSFPTSEDGDRDDYVIHPAFCVKVGAGTLLVFHPSDDVFFCHEAYFLADGAGTHRLAFVFRWLSLQRPFYVENGKHKLSQSLQEAQAERERKKRKKNAAALAACIK